MQTFEVTYEIYTEEQEQPGLSSFLQAWQSMVPERCTEPLALFHMHVHVHVCSIQHVWPTVQVRHFIFHSTRRGLLTGSTLRHLADQRSCLLV